MTDDAASVVSNGASAAIDPHRRRVSTGYGEDDEFSGEYCDDDRRSFASSVSCQNVLMEYEGV